MSLRSLQWTGCRPPMLFIDKYGGRHLYRLFFSPKIIITVAQGNDLINFLRMALIKIAISKFFSFKLLLLLQCKSKNKTAEQESPVTTYIVPKKIWNTKAVARTELFWFCYFSYQDIEFWLNIAFLQHPTLNLLETTMLHHKPGNALSPPPNCF